MVSGCLLRKSENYTKKNIAGEILQFIKMKMGEFE